MAPDRRCAGAAASAVAQNFRGNLHGAAVTDAAHDLAVPSDSTKASTSAGANKGPEITRRDVHPAPSANNRRLTANDSGRESNLAHQAALRRSLAKGEKFTQKSKSSSSPTSKPVLVRAPSRTEMKNKPSPRIDTTTSQVPPIESFSIQDILASLGPEADASIHAIAEICGRSRMSLADEHGSHRPPHSHILNLGASPADSIPSQRLETVAEAASTGPQTRSKSRRLALANVSLSPEAMSSDATAATSNVTSLAHSDRGSPRRRHSAAQSDVVPAPLLSQVFSWLRGSNLENEEQHISNEDPRAARVLRSMLGDADGIRA